MLLTKQALQAVLCASHDVSRPLQYLRIDPDGSVWATNGHVALKVTQSKELTADTDFPKVPGIPEDAVSPDATVYLPRELVEKVIKAIPRRPSVPILGRCLLVGTKTQLFVATTDLETPSVFSTLRHDPGYPNLESVYSKLKPSQSLAVEVSAEYLALVAKVESAWQRNNRPVKVTCRGPEGPLSFEWGAEGIEAHMIVMPVRL